MQNHFHLGMTLAAPYNEPPKLTAYSYTPVVNGKVSFERALDGTVHLHTLTDDMGNPAVYVDHQIEVSLRDDPSETALEKLIKLNSMLNHVLYFIPNNHCDDGIDHNSYIKMVVLTGVGKVEPIDMVQYQLLRVTIELTDYSKWGDGTFDGVNALNPIGIPNGGSMVASLSDLSDVQLASLANGDLLVYSSSLQKWENVSGVTGSLATLTDVLLSSPANNQVIAWNGTKWVNATVTTLGAAASSHTHPATVITYSPSDAADWVDPDPTTVQQALDKLADVVQSLSGGSLAASGISYSPTDAHWTNPDPTTVQQAISDLVVRLISVEGAVTPVATLVAYTPTTAANWTDPDPTQVAGALDALAVRVVALEANPFGTSAQTYSPLAAPPSDTDIVSDQFDAGTLDGAWTRVGATLAINHRFDFTPQWSKKNVRGDTVSKGVGVYAMAGSSNTANSMIGLQRALFETNVTGGDSVSRSNTAYDTLVSLPFQFYENTFTAGMWIGLDQSAGAQAFILFGVKFNYLGATTEIVCNHYTDWGTKSLSPLVNVSLTIPLTSVYLRMLHTRRHTATTAATLMPMWSTDGITYRNLPNGSSNTLYSITIPYSWDKVGIASKFEGLPTGAALWNYWRAYRATGEVGYHQSNVAVPIDYLARPDLEPFVLKVDR